MLSQPIEETREPEHGPTLFMTDMSDPLCPALVESLLDAAAEHGRRLLWGAAHGDQLTLALDGCVSQEAIVRLLAAKVLTE